MAFSGALAATAIAITLAAVAVALSYAPWAQPLGFIPLPAGFLAFVGAATLTYLELVELVKRLVPCRRAAGFLLFVPSVSAMLYAERIGPRLATGWTTGTVVSALGVYLSLKIDLPTRAAIVCAFGIVLILIALFRGVIRHRVA